MLLSFGIYSSMKGSGFRKYPKCGGPVILPFPQLDLPCLGFVSPRSPFCHFQVKSPQEFGERLIGRDSIKQFREFFNPFSCKAKLNCDNRILFLFSYVNIKEMQMIYVN